MRTIRTLLLGLCVLGLVAEVPAADSTQVFNQVNGDAALANFTVESAPGTVSAMGLVGASGDQVSTIENSRDLTMLFKLLDGGAAMGISFTPARTTLAPMNVSTYYENKYYLARAWAGTTFGYAQGTESVNDKTFQKRALSIETSFYLEPDKDDPLVVYWDNMKKAAGNPMDDKNPCVIVPAQRPTTAASSSGSGSTEAGGAPKEAPADLAAALAKRAEACRDIATKQLRWNKSRVWASWAGGTYKPNASGGANLSLGRTVVLGISYGIGDAGAKTAGALIAAAKHTSGEPTMATYDSATPTRKSTNLFTLRGSLGTEKMRGLIEASHRRDGDPTASERVYKRAIGLDLNFRKGMWLSFRAGKQRRIDNTGDETGSSVGLSINPEALSPL